MANLIGEKEAAARLGMEPVTLRAWRSRRRGPPYKRVGSGVRSAIRYDPDELDAWVRSERPGDDPKPQNGTEG